MLTKLGAVGVALATLVQLMGLCLCVTRAPASTDPHSCCPRAPSNPSESSAPGPMSSLTDQGRDSCCEGLHARTDVRVNERERLPAPASYALSSAASFTTLADRIAPFGGTASSRARASSLSRSSVLRI
jgi:hypothetical protein